MDNGRNKYSTGTKKPIKRDQPHKMTLEEELKMKKLQEQFIKENGVTYYGQSTEVIQEDKK